MVSILSPGQSNAIAAAVARAEAATRGEIVTIVTRRSVSYTTATLAIALGLSFLAAIVAHLWQPRLGVWSILTLQAGTLALGMALLEFTRIVPRLTPARQRHAQVRRLARAQFAEAGLHNTADRAAILLLVSIDERCVELIADTGIDALAAAGRWDAIAADLSASIRKDGLAAALEAAIVACGEILARHFPRRWPACQSLRRFAE